MYKKVCITNRHLVCGDFIKKIESVADFDLDIIILREKDLEEAEYEKLATDVIRICSAAGKICVLHTFKSVAVRLDHPYIHLSFKDFMVMDDKEKSCFKIIGVSTHSVDEAIKAQENGASYITASHIFPTDCKADLAPRGLEFLRVVCNSVNIPVYALGGINDGNADECIKCGAAGICMMSGFMNS